MRAAVTRSIPTANGFLDCGPHALSPSFSRSESPALSLRHLPACLSSLTPLRLHSHVIIAARRDRRRVQSLALTPRRPSFNTEGARRSDVIFPPPQLVVSPGADQFCTLKFTLCSSQLYFISPSHRVDATMHQLSVFFHSVRTLTFNWAGAPCCISRGGRCRVAPGSVGSRAGFCLGGNAGDGFF